MSNAPEWVIATIDDIPQTRPEKSDNRASLLPLAVKYEGKYDWDALDRASAVDLFPNKGSISWFNHLFGSLKEATMWLFKIKKSKTYKQEMQHLDKFIVCEQPKPKECFQLIVLGENASEDEVRRTLLNEGLYLPRPPYGKVYVRFDEHCIAGPFELGETEHGRYKPKIDDSKGIISVIRDIDGHELINASFEGSVCELISLKDEGSIPEKQDWRDDKTIIEKILKEARKRRIGSLDEFEAVSDALVQLEELIEKDSKDASLWKHRIERFKRLFNDFNSKSEELNLLVSGLLDVEEVKQNINNETEQEIERRIKDERYRVEKAIETESKQLEQLKTQRKKLEDDNSRLREEVSNRKSSLDELLSKIVEAQRLKLSSILEKPAEYFADATILNSLLSAFRGSQLVSNNTTVAKSESPTLKHVPFWQSCDYESTPLSDLETCIKYFKTHLTFDGLDESIAEPILFGVLSGITPLLHGPEASEACNALSKSICGKRIFSLNITPTMMSLEDVFGHFDCATEKFAPTPNGLCDWLMDAEGCDELCLLNLVGVDRASCSSLITSLTTLTENNLPLLPKRLAHQDDPYICFSDYRLPNNVLVTATLLGPGSDCVQIPKHALKNTIFVSVTGEGDHSISDSESDSPIGTVTKDCWQKMIITAINRDEEADRNLSHENILRHTVRPSRRFIAFLNALERTTNGSEARSILQRSIAHQVKPGQEENYLQACSLSSNTEELSQLQDLCRDLFE